MAGEESLSQLINYGAVGAMLVLSLLAVFYLFKELKHERDMRLDDLKQYYLSDKAILVELKNWVQNFLTFQKKEIKNE